MSQSEDNKQVKFSGELNTQDNVQNNIINVFIMIMLL